MQLHLEPSQCHHGREALEGCPGFLVACWAEQRVGLGPPSWPPVFAFALRFPYCLSNHRFRVIEGPTQAAEVPGCRVAGRRVSTGSHINNPGYQSHRAKPVYWVQIWMRPEPCLEPWCAGCQGQDAGTLGLVCCHRPPVSSLHSLGLPGPKDPLTGAPAPGLA